MRTVATPMQAGREDDDADKIDEVDMFIPFISHRSSCMRDSNYFRIASMMRISIG